MKWSNPKIKFGGINTKMAAVSEMKFNQSKRSIAGKEETLFNASWLHLIFWIFLNEVDRPGEREKRDRHTADDVIVYLKEKTEIRECVCREKMEDKQKQLLLFGSFSSTPTPYKEQYAENLLTAVPLLNQVLFFLFVVVSKIHSKCGLVFFCFPKKLFIEIPLTGKFPIICLYFVNQWVVTNKNRLVYCCAYFLKTKKGGKGEEVDSIAHQGDGRVPRWCLFEADGQRKKKTKMEAAKESGTKANRKSLVHVTHFIKRKRQQKPIRRAQNRKPPEKLIWSFLKKKRKNGRRVLLASVSIWHVLSLLFLRAQMMRTSDHYCV